MFLATTLQGSILDLIVVALLIFFSLVGLRQGFVNRVVGIVAGTISFAIALALCKPFANLLNAMFGMTDSLSASITKFFAKTESYNVVVSDAVEFKQLLKLKDVEFLPSFVMDAVVKMANVQKGKTIAEILGMTCGKFAAIGISFLILLILVRVLCILLKFVFTSIEDKFPTIFLANKVLGVAFGFIQCLLFIYAVLFVITLLPSGLTGWLQAIVDKSKICYFLSRKNALGFIIFLFFVK